MAFSLTPLEFTSTWVCDAVLFTMLSWLLQLFKICESLASDTPKEYILLFFITGRILVLFGALIYILPAFFGARDGYVTQLWLIYWTFPGKSLLS